MPQHGKKYHEAAKLVDRAVIYAPLEAAELARQTSTVAFDASVEAHIRSASTPSRRSDGPRHRRPAARHRQGHPRRGVRPGREGQEALRGGADEVGGDDLVKKIEAGWLEFDVALATPDLMGLVGRLGKILGRRGLMPNPKAGHDHLRPRARDQGGQGRPRRVQGRQGAGSSTCRSARAASRPQALVENLATLVDAINRAKPAGRQGPVPQGPDDRQHDGPGHPGRRARRPRGRRRGLTAELAGHRPARARPPSTVDGRRGASPTTTDGPPQTACARGPPPTEAGRPGLDPPDRIGDRQARRGRRRARRGRTGAAPPPGGQRSCEPGSASLGGAWDRRRGRRPRSADRATAARRLRADVQEGPMPTEAKRETVAELREELRGSTDADRLRVPRPQGQGDRRDPPSARPPGRDATASSRTASCGSPPQDGGGRRPQPAPDRPERHRVRDGRGGDGQGGHRRDPPVQPDRPDHGWRPRRPRDRRRRRDPARSASAPRGPPREAGRRHAGAGRPSSPACSRPRCATWATPCSRSPSRRRRPTSA